MTTRLKPAAVEMMMSDNINEAIAKGISSTIDQQLSQLKEQLLALTTKVNGIETTYQKSAEALEKFATKADMNAKADKTYVDDTFQKKTE